jgi:hypothetical protein
MAKARLRMPQEPRTTLKPTLTAAVVTRGPDGSLRLLIPLELPSVNTWIGRHWRIKHQLSQRFEQAIRYGLCDVLPVQDLPSVLYVMGMGPQRLVQEKKRVTMTRRMPSKRRFIRDDDNLTGSCKPVLDALKRIGLIRDDRRTWCDLVVAEQQVSEDGQASVAVLIETLAD